jgi:hypothetical protein
MIVAIVTMNGKVVNVVAEKHNGEQIKVFNYEMNSNTTFPLSVDMDTGFARDVEKDYWKRDYPELEETVRLLNVG